MEKRVSLLVLFLLLVGFFSQACSNPTSKAKVLGQKSQHYMPPSDSATTIQPELIAPPEPSEPHTTSKSFTVDDGFRLRCASVPRIGQRAAGAYVLFATDESKTATQGAATSSDALNFGPLSSAANKDGHPDRELLPGPTTSTLWKMYSHNNALSGFGDGVTSSDSTQTYGSVFTMSGQTNYSSPTGGAVGVMTSYTKGNHVYILTMDGNSPDHRIYLLKSTTGDGTSFTLEDSDPFGDSGKPFSDTNVDPFAYKLADGSFWTLTMKGGDVLSWKLTSSLSSNNLYYKKKVLTPSMFASVEPTGVSLHDPSIIKVGGGKYRIFVALSHQDVNDCDGDGITNEGTYSIVSATSN